LLRGHNLCFKRKQKFKQDFCNGIETTTGYNLHKETKGVTGEREAIGCEEYLVLSVVMPVQLVKEIPVSNYLMKWNNFIWNS